MGGKKAAISVVNQTPPTIRISGDITPGDLPEVASAFHAFSGPGCECVYVDAGRVGAVEELCARFLLQELRSLERKGVHVKWVRTSRRLREALEDTEAHSPCRRDDAADCGQRVVLELPCLPPSVALVRARVAEIAHQVSFTQTDVDDIVLAVGEAAANAVRHGLRFGQDCVMRVCCCVNPDSICIEITDPGDGFDPEGLRPPVQAAYHEGGLGIYLMRRVMDEVSYTFDRRGTTVRLVKRMRARSHRNTRPSLAA